MKYTDKIKKVKGLINLFHNWWMYYLDEFGFQKESYILKSKTNIKIKLRPKLRERKLVAEIWYENQYFPEFLDITGDKVIVDVGANVGIFSLFAKSINKQAKIYAIEPDAENFSLLKENIYLNNLENDVLLYNIAIGTSAEKRILYKSLDMSAIHSFYKENLQPFHKENLEETDRVRKMEVNTLSLKNFIDKENINEIDLLKLDCEGAEYEIILNTSRDVFKKIKKITMEYHILSDYKKDDLIDFLKAAGYKVRLLWEEPRTGFLYAFI